MLVTIIVSISIIIFTNIVCICVTLYVQNKISISIFSLTSRKALRNKAIEDWIKTNRPKEAGMLSIGKHDMILIINNNQYICILEDNYFMNWNSHGFISIILEYNNIIFSSDTAVDTLDMHKGNSLEELIYKIYLLTDQKKDYQKHFSYWKQIIWSNSDDFYEIINDFCTIYVYKHNNKRYFLFLKRQVCKELKEENEILNDQMRTVLKISSNIIKISDTKKSWDNSNGQSMVNAIGIPTKTGVIYFIQNNSLLLEHLNKQIISLKRLLNMDGNYIAKYTTYALDHIVNNAIHHNYTTDGSMDRHISFNILDTIKDNFTRYPDGNLAINRIKFIDYDGPYTIFSDVMSLKNLCASVSIIIYEYGVSPPDTSKVQFMKLNKGSEYEYVLIVTNIYTKHQRYITQLLTSQKFKLHLECQSNDSYYCNSLLNLHVYINAVQAM